MRFPIGKVYRAFPELDHFSDAECEKFVRRARRDHLLRWALEGVIIVIVFVVCLVVGGFVSGLLLAAVRGLLETARSDYNQLSFLVGSFTTFLAAFAGALLVRDFFLRRAFRRFIGSTKCPACPYSLLGLVATDDVVLCPECGNMTKLSSVGLVQDDLTPKV